MTEGNNIAELGEAKIESFVIHLMSITVPLFETVCLLFSL